MPLLTVNLELERCPHCNVSKPHLMQVTNFETNNHSGSNLRRWRLYKCSNCGGIVTAWAGNYDQAVMQYFPESRKIDDEIPDRPKAFLNQAEESIHAPAGAVMLAASAVDSMLKLKGYKNDSLYKRIEQAVSDNLITKEMSAWAHKVRLDANDQRHADENVDLPTTEAARRTIDFALALAQFLFVLPERVKAGIERADKPNG